MKYNFWPTENEPGWGIPLMGLFFIILFIAGIVIEFGIIGVAGLIVIAITFHFLIYYTPIGHPPGCGCQSKW